MTTISYLNSLPSETIFNILKYMTDKELINLYQAVEINTYLYQVMTDYLSQMYPTLINSLLNVKPDFKSLSQALSDFFYLAKSLRPQTGKALIEAAFKQSITYLVKVAIMLDKSTSNSSKQEYFGKFFDQYSMSTLKWYQEYSGVIPVDLIDHTYRFGQIIRFDFPRFEYALDLLAQAQEYDELISLIMNYTKSAGKSEHIKTYVQKLLRSNPNLSDQQMKYFMSLV